MADGHDLDPLGRAAAAGLGRDRLAAEDRVRREVQRAKQEAWDAAAAAGPTPWTWLAGAARQ
ncbi:MAG: hypothetical protein ABSB01_25185 [Streptosporangiaceae bacterium]|jgi:hypothetical protein